MGRSRHDLIVNANTAAAESRVRSIDSALKSVRKTAIRPVTMAINASTKGAKRAITGLVNFAKSKVGIIAGLLATAFAVKGGVGALRAAGEYETLKLRLEGVVGSAEKAKSIFSEIFNFSTVTPFDPRELVDADITLRSFGSGGVDALKSVGNAAAVAGRDMADIVAAVAGLESEPLRRLGITLKNSLGSGGKAVFSFLDKSGKTVELVADTFADARKKLLETFDIRFGGSLSGLSASLFGIVSTVKGNLGAAAAAFGNGLLGPAKEFLLIMNKALVGLRETGALAAVGKFFGDAATKLLGAFKSGEDLGPKLFAGVANVVAGFKSAGTFIEASAENVKKIVSSAFETIKDNGFFATAGTVLLEAAKGAALIFVNTVSGFFQGLGAAFSSFGTILGSELVVAFNPILKGFADFVSTLPGDRGRGALLRSNLELNEARSDMRRLSGRSTLESALFAAQGAAGDAARETAAKNGEELSKRIGNIKSATGLDNLDLRNPLKEAGDVFKVSKDSTVAELNKQAQADKALRFAEAKKLGDIKKAVEKNPADIGREVASALKGGKGPVDEVKKVIKGFRRARTRESGFNTGKTRFGSSRNISGFGSGLRNRSALGSSAGAKPVAEEIAKAAKKVEPTSLADLLVELRDIRKSVNSLQGIG